MSPDKLEIENLIEKLLHNYECVILPGFGGFIIRDSPCNFNVAKDKLKPYGKHIFFNPHLLENDGLLYNEIQKSRQLDYQESIFAYQSWLAGTRQVIEDAGSKSFGRLGTFYKGNENNIWFSPLSTLNLAMDSYGLFPVDIKTVTKHEKSIDTVVEKTSAPETEEVLTLADNKPIEVFETSKLNYKGWLIAASIALIAHIGYLSFEKSDVTVNEASVLPVIENKTAPLDSIKIADSATTPESNTESAVPETAPPVIESPAIETPVQETTVQPSAPAKTETAPVQEVIKPEPTSADIVTPAVPATPLETKVAKYKLESNANYHSEDLKKKGLDAEVRKNGDWYEVITKEPGQ